jgi:acyl-CoA dehydrogenase
MTEPDAGSDLAGMSSTAVEEDGQVVLNGAKTFISNGIHCDLVVLAAKDPETRNPHKAVSLFLVEDGTPGFKKGNRIEKLGMRSQDTAELFFTCRIPKDSRLGPKGAGFVQLMQKLQQERLVVAIWSMAIAEYILRWTRDFCRNTRCGLTPLANSQAVQFALVEMETELRIGKAFLNDLITAHSQNQQVTMETSMAKYWISEKANQIANRCLEMVGDVAAREACPIVRMWRDVRVHTIFAGTNEIMKSIIAKTLQF